MSYREHGFRFTTRIRQSDTGAPRRARATVTNYVESFAAFFLRLEAVLIQIRGVERLRDFRLAEFDPEITVLDLLDRV